MLKTDNNIAQTGIRILFVLQLLMKSPVSKAQIIEKINADPNLKSITPDTITLDINTLKAAGFDIKSGNKGNNYCYELKLNPIKIKLTKNELRAISIAKKAMFYFMDFRYIVSIYQTFEKISKLIESKEYAEEILNFGNFLKTDFNLIKELENDNFAVCILNKSGSEKKVYFNLAEAPAEIVKGRKKLFDVWAEKEYEQSEISLKIPAHGCVVFKSF